MPVAPFPYLLQPLVNRIGRLPLQGLSDFPAINGEGLGEFEDGVAVEGEGSLEQGFQAIADEGGDGVVVVLEDDETVATGAVDVDVDGGAWGEAVG